MRLPPSFTSFARRAWPFRRRGASTKAPAAPPNDAAAPPAPAEGAEVDGGRSLSPVPAPAPPQHPPVHRSPKLGPKAARVALAAAAVAVVGGGAFVALRDGSKAAAAPGDAVEKPVTAVPAISKPFQPSRVYVGTLEPWFSASIGPQFISAYVDTVLVRPGAPVKRGEVLATLDCREATAENKAVESEARAIAARQKASANEAARLNGLLAQKFVSPNEAEQKTARSLSEEADLEAKRATMVQKSLEMNDCVLRAPFDGEVSDRKLDPGAFVRPGNEIVGVVDRSTIRYTADVPEMDFAIVAPGRKATIVIPSTGQRVVGTISRRAPAADPSTRTVHFEMDLADPDRAMPVGTTGEAHIDVGAPEPATAIPLSAALVRGKKATVFVVEDGIAHAKVVRVKGEVGGELFVDAGLAAGSLVVTEGRAVLGDGDHVRVKVGEGVAPAAPASAAPSLVQVKSEGSAHLTPAVAPARP